MTDEKEKENVYITYPRGGGTASLDRGETVIDFYTGKVMLPNKTTNDLSDALANTSHKVIRSITILAGAPITISLDGGGEFYTGATTAESEYFTLSNQSFRYLKIVATTGSWISIWASTHPEGAISSAIGAGGVIYAIGVLTLALRDISDIRIHSSTKASHFTDAIAQNVAEQENLTGIASNHIIIKNISLTCTQQLNFRLHFYSKDTFLEDNWLGSVDLDLTAFGIRYTNTGDYLMDVEVDMIYQDADATTELHVALENLSATTKSAYATTETIVKIGYEMRRSKTGD